MGFREDIAEDLDQEFLDLDEFGREVQVDDGDGTGPRTIKAIRSEVTLERHDRPGAITAGLVLRCKAADLDQPKLRQIITVDSTPYLVVGVEDNPIGLRAITLERRES